MGGIVITARIVGAVHPSGFTATCIDDIPSVQATFEAFSEGRVAAGAAATAAARSRHAFGIPHGPAGAGHVEVAHTVDDLDHHIAQVNRLPDAHAVLDGLVAVEGHVHLVIASTEAVEGIEAGLVEDDRLDRVELLLGLVVVGEGHLDAFRAVGAVEQHVDSHAVLVLTDDVHILVEAVRPDGLALTRQSQLVAVVAARNRSRADTATISQLVDADEVRVLLDVAEEGHLAVVLGNMATARATGIEARSGREVEHRATKRVGRDVVVIHAVVAVVEAEHVLDIVLVLVVSQVGDAGRSRTSGHDGTLTVDEGQVAAPVTNDPEAITLRIVGDTTHGAVGAGEGIDQSMAVQVDAIDSAAVGNAVDVLTVEGHATERAAARNLEAFDHVALHVILVEVMRSSAVAPVGGVDVLAIGDHTVMGGFSSVEGGHQIPRSADALFTRDRVRIVFGSGVASNSDRSSPVDGSLNHLAAVALIDGTDAPLVDTRLKVGPLNVDVDGVGHPDGGQEDGVLLSERAFLIAVRTIHSVVVQATVDIFGLAQTVSFSVSPPFGKSVRRLLLIGLASTIGL